MYEFLFFMLLILHQDTTLTQRFSRVIEDIITAPLVKDLWLYLRIILFLLFANLAMRCRILRLFPQILVEICHVPKKSLEQFRRPAKLQEDTERKFISHMNLIECRDVRYDSTVLLMKYGPRPVNVLFERHKILIYEGSMQQGNHRKGNYILHLVDPEEKSILLMDHFGLKNYKSLLRKKRKTVNGSGWDGGERRENLFDRRIKNSQLPSNVLDDRRIDFPPGRRQIDQLKFREFLVYPLPSTN